MLHAARLRAALATASVRFTWTGSGATALAGRFGDRGFPSATPSGTADVWFVGADVTLTPARGADTANLAAGAARAVAALAPGGLVLVCGPVPSGATRAVVLPVLASAGRTPGADAFLAHVTVPDATGRVCVGGLTPACGDLAAEVLAAAGHATARVGALEAAELAGLVGAVVRTVRAALGAEVAAVAAGLGADPREVLGAVGAADLLNPTEPDAHAAAALFAWGARRTGGPTRLTDLACESAAARPAALFAGVADALNGAGRPVRGRRVLLIGDHPHAADLAARLAAKGAVVTCVAGCATPAPAALATCDAVVLLGPVPELDPASAVARAPLVVDACGATRGLPPGPGRVARL